MILDNLNIKQKINRKKVISFDIFDTLLERKVQHQGMNLGRLRAIEAAGWSRAWFGHPGEDARLAADW